MRYATIVCAIVLASGTTANADDQACLGCHPMIQAAIQAAASNGISHPAIALGCATCHVDHGPNPTTAAASQYLKATGSALCQTCHAGVLAKEFVHEPAKTDCSFCHNPHGGPGANLRAESNALCLECHSTDAKSKFGKETPTKLFTGQVTVPAGTFGEVKLVDLHADRGHPVSNHPVLRAADKEWPAVSCVACHNPHGANNSPAFLQNESETFLLCLRCHQ